MNNITRPHDEPEVFTWLQNASHRGGSFIKHLALAAFYADDHNYPILRPVILKMKEKYPEYSGDTHQHDISRFEDDGGPANG